MEAPGRTNIGCAPASSEKLALFCQSLVSFLPSTSSFVFSLQSLSTASKTEEKSGQRQIESEYLKREC